MPAISAITISGHDYIPENFNLNFKRQVSVQGIPTSEPSWGTLTFSVVLEMESDSDTFLAAWMAAPYQMYIASPTVTVGQATIGVKPA
jgi:hypothetical protein